MTPRIRPVAIVITKYLLYFVVLAGLQAILGFSRGIGYDNAHKVSIGATAPEIVHALWPTDFALYIHAAQAIPVYHLRFFTGDFSMYPPGLSYLEYAILKFWPLAPLYAVLFVISLSLWAAFMMLVNMTLSRVFNLKTLSAFLLPLSLLIFPFFTNDYLWSDVGLTECIASPLFFMGCMGGFVLLFRPRRYEWIIGIVTGLCFAIAAYTRAQFDLIATGLMAVSCLYLLLRLLSARRAMTADLKIQILVLLVMIVTYQAATLPYKYFKHSSTIVSMDSFIWKWVWMNKQDAAKLNIMTDKGMQSICEIAPAKCSEFTVRRDKGEAIDFHEYKQAVISQAFHHPIALLRIKLPLFWHFWNIDMFEDMPKAGSWRGLSEYILLFSIPLTALYAFLCSRLKGLLYSFYMSSFIVTCLGFSVIAHIEARYFLPIKLLAALSLLFVIIDIYQREKISKPQSDPLPVA